MQKRVLLSVTCGPNQPLAVKKLSFRWPAILERALGAHVGHGVGLLACYIGYEILRGHETLAILIHETDMSERCSSPVVGTESAAHWGQISRLGQHKTSHLH